MPAFTDEQITLGLLHSENFPVDKVKISGQRNISGLQHIANMPCLERYVKYLWDWHAKQSNKQSVDEVWLLVSWPTRQRQKRSWGRKIDVKKQNFRQSSSACAQAKKKREPMATSPLINWPRLFHAVVCLWCRHVRWLGEKIFMELSHKPERRRKREGGRGVQERKAGETLFPMSISLSNHFCSHYVSMINRFSHSKQQWHKETKTPITEIHSYGLHPVHIRFWFSWMSQYHSG